MIHKILWAFDGSEDSLQSLKHAETLAFKYNSEILSIYVLPDYANVIDTFPVEERNKFASWIENTLKQKEEKVLEEIGERLRKNNIGFRIFVERGIPYKEILRIAEKEKANLIALGKGRVLEKFILGGTALKVLRRSSIPVLTAKSNGRHTELNRILVPIDLSHGVVKDFSFAHDISKDFNAQIFILNVVEIGEYKFPPEIVERMRGFAFREMKETIGKVKVERNVEIKAEAARNGWTGIVEFAKKNDIDLIVMMSYGGKKIKEDFIGSVAEKVIQEAPCPVLTMTP